MESEYKLPKITSETHIKFHDLKFAEPDDNGEVIWLVKEDLKI